jgi:hypothetical protein
MAEDTSPLVGLKIRPPLDPRTAVEVAAVEAPTNPSVFLAAGRHPQESLGPVGGWKCPSCLAEQTGRFELGCTACGAGRPGQHVGEAPPLRREDLEAPLAGEDVQQPIRVRGAAPIVFASDAALVVEAEAAFEAWWASKAILVPGWRLLFRECWLTAWQIAISDRAPSPSQQGVAMVETQIPDGGGPDRAGIVARTIAAALDHFIDTILREAESEIADGTWLSVEAAQALSQRYKDSLE